jgi:uncharacterized membrane protein YgcG
MNSVRATILALLMWALAAAAAADVAVPPLSGRVVDQIGLKLASPLRFLSVIVVH